MTADEFMALPEGTKLYLQEGYTGCGGTFEAGTYTKVWSGWWDVQRLVDDKPVGGWLLVLNDDMYRLKVITEERG